MIPDPTFLERFRQNLDEVLPSGQRIGIAVSGGKDSTALLLLAAAARPNHVEAATVDHGLRPDSLEEAQKVAELCARSAVPHDILTAIWAATPTAGLQERARAERYRLLGRWALERGLDAIATGHHADDQAETFLMRLQRGAGVNGLAGMRRRSSVPGVPSLPLLRPLLTWRRAELASVCASAGASTIEDPSNDDEQFERVRIRKTLAGANWLDPAVVTLSAAHLGEAQAALEWSTEQQWQRSVKVSDESISYSASDAPSEIRRRIAARAIGWLATEGPDELRGRELDRIIRTLEQGEAATLRGVRCRGGTEWQFTRARRRRR